MEGDATMPSQLPAVIVHVCNDVGGWGKGFVLALSRRWPEPERAYRAAFAGSPRPSLGDVQFVEVEPGITVANLIGQRDIRRDVAGRPPIRYEAVRAGLETVSHHALAKRASVHMPRIGCGLAGGTWAEIEPLIQATLVTAGVAVFVYDFPPAAR
jgi:O-acetyl-ADP-ribose deacetylase (regulator of RNase III)